MKRIGLIAAVLLIASPAFAADNAVIVTPGTGVTMKSKDIGSGVQAMQPVLSDTSGTALATPTAGADALTNSTEGLAVWGFPMVYNGTTWDRLRGDATNGAFVNVKTSVLPTGAATLTGLTTINTTLGSPFQAGGSIGNTTFGATPVTTNTASVASWSTGTSLNTVVTITNAGNYPANQLSLSASANVTVGAITFQGTKADGTDETIPVAQVLNPNTLAPLTNPYTLTTSKQDFLIVTQGYQTIKAKLTTAITTSSGAGTTVISNTNVSYNPVTSALLNPLAAGPNIIGKLGIDQTTPGSTNGVNLQASASGGCTPGVILTAASNNSTSIKASPGTLCELSFLNTTTGVFDIRLYDTASAPTCSSATGVVANYVAQSNATNPGFTINLGPYGKAFATGIGVCVTGANANNDNTNAATGGNLNYAFK